MNKAVVLLWVWLLSVGHCASDTDRRHGSKLTEVEVELLQIQITDIAHDQGPEGDNGSYVCVCMDWWPESKCDFGHCPWVKASVLNAPLDNPRIIGLVKAFHGVTLRIGGSLADSIVYQDEEHQTPCLPIEKSAASPYGFQHGCLTRERWTRFTEFASEVNAKLMFGINAMYGRNGIASNPWDPSNAKAFLEFLRDNDLAKQIIAFEYGNELHHFFNMTAADHAAGFYQLNDLLLEVFGEDRRSEFWLLGPDVAAWKRESFMDEFVKATKSILYGLSWHSYPLGPSYNGSKPLSEIMMRADKMATLGEKQTRHVQQDAPQLKLIMGESGGAFNSGNGNCSNRFMDSFWYLKSMAQLAKNKHEMFCRQTLIGGFYELIDQTTHRPNPSYFAALMFKRLMGREVWHTHVVSGQEDPKQQQQHVYAHCQKRQGRLTLLVLNYSPNVAVSVEVEGRLPADLVPRDEYIVAGHSLKNKTVLLNGRVLKATREGEFELEPNTVTNAQEHIAVKPHSYAFIQFGRESEISKKQCGGSR